MTELCFFNNFTNCSPSVVWSDQACITVNSAAEKNIQLSAQSEACYSCDYQPWCTVGPLESISFAVHTVYPLLLRYSFNNSKWCLRNFTFKEYGVYGWNISDNMCNDLHIIEEPVAQLLPIIVAASFLLIISILYYAFSVVVESEWFTKLKRTRVSSSEIQKDLGSPNAGDAASVIRNEVPQSKPQQKRVAAVDVFRGLCVAVMIFVNGGGGSYWFFRHGVWNAPTIADVVFPWFMWIMGLSLAISLHMQLYSNKPRLQILRKILCRSLILYCFGVCLTNMNGYLNQLKVTGVLQTLANCYMVIGMIETLLMSQDGAFRRRHWIVLLDIIESWRQWLLVLALAGAHTSISLALPVPGCPRGYLGPGGWHMHGQYANCTGGAAGYIDRLILTPSHMYWSLSSKYIYHYNQEVDAYGLLTNLTQILLTYLGFHAGRIMQCYNYTFTRISHWLSWGLVTGTIAGILCGFSKHDGIIPLNKTLSSLSFVLANASMAFIFFSILYFVVDCNHWWSGAPFIYAGRNALLLYLGHWFSFELLPWGWKPIYNNHAEKLAINLWTTTVWLIIAYIMFKRNCFVTV